MQVIIFSTDGDAVSVIIPTPEFADQIEQIAEDQVPGGASWRIIDASALPSRDARDRWQWTASGALTVADPTSAVPASITRVQFVRAARAAGLWDTYKTAIEAHEDWPYVTEIPRDDAMVLAMASGLGFTEQQLDDLWIAGAQL